MRYDDPVHLHVLLCTSTRTTYRVQVCISITNRPPSTLATDGHRDLNQFAAERLLLAAVKGVVVVQPPLKTQKSNSDRRHYTQVYTLIAPLLPS